MKMIPSDGKRPGLLTFIVALAWLTFAPADLLAEEWSVEAELLESCCCDVVCPCLFGSGPTQGHCHGNRLVEIKSGHYGDVRLNGVSMVLTFKVGKWTKIYISDKATEKQAKAAEELVRKLKGGFVFGEVLEVKRVPLSVERDEDTVKYSVPASSTEVKLMRGANDKPIRIQNLPTFRNYTQYKSIKLTHESPEEAQSFEEAGTNGFLAEYEASSKD